MPPLRVLTSNCCCCCCCYHRLTSFYKATRLVPYLEHATVQKMKRPVSEFGLVLEPLGYQSAVMTVLELRRVLRCVVLCVVAVHHLQWCINDIRQDNIVQTSEEEYCVIDAGEFAQRFGKPVHARLATVDATAATACSARCDIFKLVQLMEDLTTVSWNTDASACSFYEQLKVCHTNNSLQQAVHHAFINNIPAYQQE